MEKEKARPAGRATLQSRRNAAVPSALPGPAEFRARRRRAKPTPEAKLAWPPAHLAFSIERAQSDEVAALEPAPDDPATGGKP
jgi:hypothetical protein